MECQYEYDSSDNDTSEREERGTSWVDVAWLMLSDIVGTSVLTFGIVATTLGSLLSVVFIVGLFPVSLYVSVLMSRTRALIVDTAEMEGRRQPSLRTMGDVASQIFRARKAGIGVCAVVYGYTLLGNASYLLVLGTSLQMIFYTSGMCIYDAVAIGCAVTLVPIFFVRRLGESVWLCLINLFLIVLVVVMALGSIVRSGQGACTHTPMISPGLTLSTALGAATNVVYSYAGQWMYFEIMDTMESPRTFPRAFAVTGPIMVSIYLTVSLVSYYYGAAAGDIVESMPRGTLFQVTAGMLFAHVLIVYLIKSVVLQQYIHGLVSPVDSEKRNVASYMKHGGFGMAMMVFGFAVANAVPFFSQLLGLIGGLLGGPINFIFPIYLYLAALGRNLHAQEGSEAPSEEDGDYSDEDWKLQTTSSVSAACRGFRSLNIANKLCISLTVLIIGMTMVIGVSQVVRDIIALQDTMGRPFDCHALPSVSEMNSTGCAEAPDVYQARLMELKLT